MPLDGAAKTTIQPKALTLDDFRPGAPDKPFLIISYGCGNDSTALLVMLWKMGIRPDLIIFSDTGSERAHTYRYLPIINAWLRSVGFPEVTVIKAKRTRDLSIESYSLRLGVFASLSYNKHTCSVMWKIQAAKAFLKKYLPVKIARKEGRIIARMIGFHKGEEYRARRADENSIQEQTDEKGCKRTTAFAVSTDDNTVNLFPLIEQGIDFDGVLDMIWSVGLPTPGKSSCHFCAAMSFEEIADLAANEPHLFFRSLVLERIVQRNLVNPAGRVQGISFGDSWSKYDFAAPYLEKIDEVINFFNLDRTILDGKKDPKNQEWRPKAARVELFRECFGTAENLRAFMRGELDMKYYADQIEATKLIQTEIQMSFSF